MIPECIYYLTYRCDSLCEHCSIWSDKKYQNIEEAPLSLISKNLEALKAMGIKKILFTGGEPLLREDLPEIIDSAFQKGFEISLITEGVFYPAIAEKIKNKILHLYFSLDAPIKDLHERIRGIENFDEILQSLRQARDLKQNPIIFFTLTRETIAYLPEMVELAGQEKVRLWLNPVYHCRGLEGFTRDSIAYIKYFLKRKNVGGSLAALTFIKGRGNNMFFPRCRAVDTVITLTPDNKVVGPCFFNPVQTEVIQENLPVLYQKIRILTRSKQGRNAIICQNCMRWEYILPSFKLGFDKYRLLEILQRRFL